MRTTVIKDAEGKTEGADDLEEGEEDQHVATNTVTLTVLVLITATSVVQKLLDIRSLQLLTTNKADRPKTAPLEKLGKN